MTRRVVFLLLASSLLGFAGSMTVHADPPAKSEAKKGDGFSGRTKEGKARLLKEFGGSEEGEEAVMLGLAWLTQMQKKDGNWECDRGVTNDHAVATGMAVLAFVGAGQSHKEGRYKQSVQAGLNWLVKNVDMGQGRDRGKIKTITNMYSQGIATLALCEAYGMTHDPALRDATQAAIDYIQKGQGLRGSWGYEAGTDNDTSILGWQIQALHAAQLAQGLTVDPKVIEKALKFLDSVSGKTKSTYGYRNSFDAQPATSLTSIGLLCRYYVNGWRRDTPAFAEGAKGLLKRAPNPQSKRLDLYYCYYATQVVRFYGGEEWRIWNEGTSEGNGRRTGGLPDLLLSLQDRTPANRGSWDPRIDTNHASFGPNCGRLGSTCFCLLMLEVYYRYVPENTQQNQK